MPIPIILIELGLFVAAGQALGAMRFGGGSSTDPEPKRDPGAPNPKPPSKKAYIKGFSDICETAARSPHLASANKAAPGTPPEVIDFNKAIKAEMGGIAGGIKQVAEPVAYVQNLQGRVFAVVNNEDHNRPAAAFAYAYMKVAQTRQMAADLQRNGAPQSVIDRLNAAADATEAHLNGEKNKLASVFKGSDPQVEAGIQDVKISLAYMDAEIVRANLGTLRADVIARAADPLKTNLINRIDNVTARLDAAQKNVIASRGSPASLAALDAITQEGMQLSSAIAYGAPLGTLGQGAVPAAPPVKPAAPPVKPAAPPPTPAELKKQREQAEYDARVKHKDMLDGFRTDAKAAQRLFTATAPKEKVAVQAKVKDQIGAGIQLADIHEAKFRDAAPAALNTPTVRAELRNFQPIGTGKPEQIQNAIYAALAKAYIAVAELERIKGMLVAMQKDPPDPQLATAIRNIDRAIEDHKRLINNAEDWVANTDPVKLQNGAVPANQRFLEVMNKGVEAIDSAYVQMNAVRSLDIKAKALQELSDFQKNKMSPEARDAAINLQDTLNDTNDPKRIRELDQAARQLAQAVYYAEQNPTDKQAAARVQQAAAQANAVIAPPVVPVPSPAQPTPDPGTNPALQVGKPLTPDQQNKNAMHKKVSHQPPATVVPPGMYIAALGGTPHDNGQYTADPHLKSIVERVEDEMTTEIDQATKKVANAAIHTDNDSADAADYNAIRMLQYAINAHIKQPLHITGNKPNHLQRTFELCMVNGIKFHIPDPDKNPMQHQAYQDACEKLRAEAADGHYQEITHSDGTPRFQPITDVDTGQDPASYHPIDTKPQFKSEKVVSTIETYNKERAEEGATAKQQNRHHINPE